MTDRPLIERIVIDGVELPLAHHLIDGAVGDVEIERLTEFMDAIVESEVPEFILSAAPAS